MEENNYGIVYLLKNAAMPGLVKIGFTFRKEAKTRMKELYTAGVPVPFECIYAAKVANHKKVEDALHIAFGPHRINLNREFFKIDQAQAIAIIKLLEIEDVTPQVVKTEQMVDKESRNAARELSKKRPKLNFTEMKIPIGSELIANKNGEIAKVISDRLVNFRDIESLTNATKQVLEIEYDIAPGPYWIYNGRTIREIYDETYTKED